MKFKRVFLTVMDSVGIGEAPDAEKFGDKGSDTLGHIAEKMNGLNMPVMGKLGLSNIREIKGIQKAEKPMAYYTKMQEASNGKDTMTGHWEIMGLNIETPFRVFPDGFPDELIKELEEKKGVVVPASFKPEDELEAQPQAYEFYNLEEGTGAKNGPWAEGLAPDGTGEFVFLDKPEPMGQVPNPAVPPTSLHHDIDMP